jgi:hypothetical protein
MQPGQFFTEYLDDWPKIKRYVLRDDWEKAQEFNTNARRDGIIFALPYGGILTDRKLLKPQDYHGDILRPPYPTCIFEFVGDHNANVPYENRSSKRIAVAFDRGEHVELMVIAQRDLDGRWMPPPVLFRLPYNEKRIFQLNPETGLSSTAGLLPYLINTCAHMLAACDGDIEKFYSTMAYDFGDELWAYLDFCRVMNERQVDFTDIDPDKAKNQMRRARGKVPLFAYKVLTIGKKKRKSAHLGGTHASPRSHLRRGYYRTSKTGKRHWVQPCMVKGETPGFVHKDYRVEGDEETLHVAETCKENEETFT